MEPVSKAAARALSIASEKHPPAASEPQGLPARIIDRVWTRMAEIYGHKWTSAYGEEDLDGTWAKGLADMTATELKAGFIACVTRPDAWPPSLPEFRRLCRPQSEKRENEAMYRFPPDRQLPHMLSDEDRTKGRQALAAIKSRLA